MDLSGKRLLVTGGAGLIGSALVDRLVADNEVVVADDLSNGDSDSVPEAAEFVEADLTDADAVESVVTSDLDAVFHLAAADKYVDTDRPRHQFEANTRMTLNVLERMDAVGVSNLAFTSSCTVYGEAPRPTPEEFGPPEPISVYGATKLAEEALLSVYAHSHGFTAWSFRFANIVGPRFGAGVVPDFVEKLHEDPETLTILGNGLQEKSYMHREDCVEAMCFVVERADGPFGVYNLGTPDAISVNRVADVVSEVMGLDPEYEYTGGERGWTGDVPRVQLSLSKLEALGWEHPGTSADAVRRAATELVDGPA